MKEQEEGGYKSDHKEKWSTVAGQIRNLHNKIPKIEENVELVEDVLTELYKEGYLSEEIEELREEGLELEKRLEREDSIFEDEMEVIKKLRENETIKKGREAVKR